MIGGAAAQAPWIPASYCAFGDQGEYYFHQLPEARDWTSTLFLQGKLWRGLGDREKQVTGG